MRSSSFLNRSLSFLNFISQCFLFLFVAGCFCFMRWHVCLSTYTNNTAGEQQLLPASICNSKGAVPVQVQVEPRGADSGKAVSQGRRRRWHMAIFHYPRATRLGTGGTNVAASAFLFALCRHLRHFPNRHTTTPHTPFTPFFCHVSVSFICCLTMKIQRLRTGWLGWLGCMNFILCCK